MTPAHPPRSAWLALLPALLWGCTLDERCHETRDCPSPMLCDTAAGECVYECEGDEDCDGVGFACVDHVCQFDCSGGAELTCPGDMAAVCGSFCMDLYEASRPDATSTSGGTDTSVALSRADVMPWYTETLTPLDAEAACAAAGKRLCQPREWEVVCSDVDQTAYVYGDTYDPEVCNAIDTHCDPACGVYPDCYWDCESDYTVLPTASFAGCVNRFGVYDLSGNVWEAVQGEDGADHFRGGAFNCGDPALAHTCAYDGVAAGPFPSARGFRCCAVGESGP